LHDQDPKRVAQALNGNAKKGRIDFLTRFRHEAKALGRGGVCGIDDLIIARHTAHQPFANAHAGLVNRRGVQAFRCAKLQCVLIAKEVD